MPVLLREVLAQLELKPGLSVVDGTVGAGGHSAKILPRIQPDGRLIGLDRDPMMLELARQAIDGEGLVLVHASYADLRTILDDMNIPAVDRVLLDLGLSSDQLADRSRGFGFDVGGPLDLRFDVTQGEPAGEWLRTASEAEIADTLHTSGEERHAERIAAAIVDRRRTEPVHTAEELAELCLQVVPGGGRRADRHPATRVFQALRIVVNQELEQLEGFLSQTLPACLAPGGRAAIISFHSLEDRLVKQTFQRSDQWQVVTRKPTKATPAEARINPRSRSAALRVAVRLSDDAERN